MASAGHRSELSPAQKFKERFATFLTQCPDKNLRATLEGHLGRGEIRQFQAAAGAAVNATDPASFRHLMAMLKYIHDMQGDYSGLRPPSQLRRSSAAGTGPSTERSPAQKFNARFANFMEKCPDDALRDKLGGLLAGGKLNEFRSEAKAAAIGTGDPKLASLLQPMLRALNDMNGDYSEMFVNIPRSRP